MVVSGDGSNFNSNGFIVRILVLVPVLVTVEVH